MPTIVQHSCFLKFVVQAVHCTYLPRPAKRLNSWASSRTCLCRATLHSPQASGTPLLVDEHENDRTPCALPVPAQVPKEVAKGFAYPRNLQVQEGPLSSGNIVLDSIRWPQLGYRQLFCSKERFSTVKNQSLLSSGATERADLPKSSESRSITPRRSDGLAWLPRPALLGLPPSARCHCPTTAGDDPGSRVHRNLDHLHRASRVGPEDRCEELRIMRGFPGGL